MKSLLQPKEARIIIDELLDYDNRTDLGIYLKSRITEFSDDILWIKLSDRLQRTTHVEEDSKWEIMNTHYTEDEWNKEVLQTLENRYIFLQEYFRRQIQKQLDDRSNRVLKINALPKLAVRCNMYVNSSTLRQKFYGVNYVNDILNIVNRATNYLLFDIQKNYSYEEATIGLDTLLHIYFVENLWDGLNRVGSCIRSYDIVEDGLTNTTATKFEIIDNQALYDINFLKARRVFKIAFSRTYYEYIKRLVGKSKDFEAYKKWEIYRWEQVQKIYTINDWGYDVINKYLEQVRRYTDKDLVLFKPKQEHLFGLDKIHKPWIIDFFNKVGTAYQSEFNIPLLHPNTTPEDVADLLTADDYTQAKPIYFLAKSNVIAYILTNIYNILRDISLDKNLNAEIGNSGKVMYRKGIINIENASDVDLSSYKSLTRTSVYEGVKSFDKNVKAKVEYEFGISLILKTVLTSMGL